MKRFVVLIVLSAVTLASAAPEGLEKLDVRLRQLVQGQASASPKSASLKAKAKPAVYVGVFLRGDVDALDAAVKAAGGFVNTKTKSIISAQVPLNKILELAQKPVVSRIRLGSKMKARNDWAIEHVGANRVLAGEAPLTSPLTGKNVIVGVIDSGIDWQHADFRDPADDSKSRILSIWDQKRESGTPPQGFSYGTEYTKAQIEDEIDGTPTGEVEHRDDDPGAGGHGTHVAGTAAGNQGVAREADIIAVGLDFENSTGVVDGANYIFQIAESLGRPAVINASLGSHTNRHDGGSDEAIGLSELVTAQAGRHFCVAAGNEGGDFIHWGGFDISANNGAWTYFYGEPGEAETVDLSLYMIVENKDANTVYLTLGVEAAEFDKELSPVNTVSTSASDWVNVGELLSQGEATLEMSDDEGNYGTVYVSAAGMGDNLTEVNINIQDQLQFDEEGYYQDGLDLWWLLVEGQGTCHVWSEGVKSVPDPNKNGLTVDDAFIPTDNRYSIGVPGDARDVITVGAYTNRDYWLDVNGQDQPAEEEEAAIGSLADFSSKGPTQDGRTKPDITAPGHYVMSTLSVDITPEENMTGESGIHKIESGTSMATPVVCGSIALLLEQFPEAYSGDVKSLLLETAVQDEHTASEGDLPNNFWGFGKLDIFSAIATQFVEETN